MEIYVTLFSLNPSVFTCFNGFDSLILELHLMKLILFLRTFIPLFGLFTLPVLAGLDVVTGVDFLEKKGLMNWTQVFGLDMKKLMKRVNDNDDFSPIAPADWNMHTVSEE